MLLNSLKYAQCVTGGYMSRRVVTVFGGSGFIGRTVVQKLAAKGWIVRVAVTDPIRAEFLTTAGDVGQVLPLRIDVRNRDSVAKALVGADAAVNLVGILTEGGGRTFQSMHVDSAANIAAAARDAKITTLVHMSALGASRDSNSAYARSKAEGEAAVLGAFPNAVILRPSLVFGADDDFFNRFARMACISPFLPVFTRDGLKVVCADGLPHLDLFGSGGTVFQPVWVGDVAQAVVNAVADPALAGKIFELGGAQRYSFKELLEVLLQATQQSVVLAPMPFWLARLLAPVLSLLPGKMLTPDQVRQMESDNVVRGGKPGLSELGITPTALTAIVPGYLTRFRSNIGQPD